MLSLSVRELDFCQGNRCRNFGVLSMKVTELGYFKPIPVGILI